MRRLAMLALAGAAVFGPAAAAGPGYAGPGYTRECGGTVDQQCWEFHCRAVDCFRYDCVLYLNTHQLSPLCVTAGGVS